LVWGALFFGVTVLLTAVAPVLPLALLALVAVGFCSVSFTSLGNATLQLESVPEMRGRVMSLWTMAFLGTTPIGGPIIGWVGEHAGPRLALTIGGVAAFAAAGLGARAFREAAGRQGGEESPVVSRQSAVVGRKSEAGSRTISS